MELGKTWQLEMDLNEKERREGRREEGRKGERQRGEREGNKILTTPMCGHSFTVHTQ